MERKHANQGYSKETMIRRSAVALAILAASAMGAELTLSRGVLSADKPALLEMTLAAGKDLPTGIQFDLEYDPAALDLSVEAGPVAQKAAKGLRSAQIRAGKLRVLIIGINRNTISDGVVAVVHVTYKGSDAGKTFPLHVTAAAGTNANAESVAVTVNDGSVKVEK